MAQQDHRWLASHAMRCSSAVMAQTQRDRVARCTDGVCFADNACLAYTSCMQHTIRGIPPAERTFVRMLKGVGLAFFPVVALAAASQSLSAKETAASFYELKTSYLDGKPADLGVFRGKVTLVVNVASQCGYTPQYEGLEKLHRETRRQGIFRPGISEQRFRRPGTRHAAGNRDVLQAHLRCDVPDVLEARDEAGGGAIADLPIPRNLGAPPGVELQQVSRRQGRPGARVFPERGHARSTGAAPRHHESARVAD